MYGILKDIKCKMDGSVLSAKFQYVS